MLLFVKLMGEWYLILTDFMIIIQYSLFLVSGKCWRQGMLKVVNIIANPDLLSYTRRDYTEVCD